MSLRSIACVLSLAALCGCSTFSGYPTSYQNQAQVLQADQAYLTADVRDKGDAPSDTARGGLTQQQYRDTVIYRRLEVIDSYYYDFEAKLTGTYNGLDVGANLAVLALNGFGAVTGGAGSKAALAAASAGVVGAKSVVNTDIFYQKTLPTLIAEMRAARAQVLVKIETGISNPVAKYSIDQALNDVNDYYIAGTLPGAIAQVTAQAGAATQDAMARIDALRTTSYQPLTPTAQRIVQWLFPGGDQTQPPDPKKLASLQAWMAGYKADPRLASIPYILLLNASDASLEADRAQAIADLGVP